MWWLSLACAAELSPVRIETPLGAGERTVAAAKAHLGVPYAWNGRLTSRLPGLDCLGILFRADGDVHGRSWRTYEVDPSKLVAGGKLGRPVRGLDGVTRAALDVRQLKPGDTLYLLTASEIPDTPLWNHDGIDLWPWHTAMYAGNGLALHAKPGGVVTVEPLDDLWFEALYVTRH